MAGIDFKVVIPARYGASRLPGKPLIEIAGAPLIRHVYERAGESTANETVIATDDVRIADTCTAFGADVALTRTDHRSGTDRIAEVAVARQVTRYLVDQGRRHTRLVALEVYQDAVPRPTTGHGNFGDAVRTTAVIGPGQGDEPCMPPALIDQVARDLAGHGAAGMATLAYPIRDTRTLFDSHAVKVVTDADGYALYFSRAPIPWHRDESLGVHGPLPQGVRFLRHIGLYAYRIAFLARFVGWRPAPLELAESLEQLRVLWHGEAIHVTQATQEPGPGVDTPADVQRVIRYLGVVGD